MKNTKNSSKKQGNSNSSSSFDPKALRLPQDFSVAEGVKQLIHTIPVRKPSKQEFVRTHPEPDYRMEAALIDFEEDRQVYLVTPGIAATTRSDWYPVTLFLTITRQGNPILWPVKRAKDSSRPPLLWHTSAMEAATQAKDSWLRVQANMALQGYDIFLAGAAIQEPQWPDLGFSKILEIAFGGRVIDRQDHPVLLRLRGVE